MSSGAVRRLAALAALAVLSAVRAIPAAAAAPSDSQIVATDIPLAQGSAEMRRLNVYLPPGYDATSGGSKYPLLVMLHGSPGSADDWLSFGAAQATLDRLIGAGKIPPLIVAFPDGNGGWLRDTQFINSADGKEPVEDFIAHVVPSYVSSRFRADRDPKHVAIGGLSSGGYGALNVALKHPEAFGYLLSLSGYGRIDQNVFSAPFIGGSAAFIAANSPLVYIPTLPAAATRILLITGESDQFLSQNHELDAALKARGFAVDLESFPGGHTWAFWKAHFEDALLWLAARLPRG
jgi:enterochelin esterase-like enzyme